MMKILTGKNIVRILYPMPLIFAAACLWPVNSGANRLLIVGGFSGTWMLVVMLLWRWRRAAGIAALCVPPALMALVAFRPWRDFDKDELSALYLEELRGYENTKYLWGGENLFGIDCSGLPRKALRSAMWYQGVKTLNFLLIRKSLESWWFDASARALAEGYRDYALPYPMPGGTVMTAPRERLHPGDLAITEDGVHVMVYLGAGSWIQAAPDAGRVMIEDPASSNSPWFTRPVRFYFWQVFK